MKKKLCTLLILISFGVSAVESDSETPPRGRKNTFRERSPGAENREYHVPNHAQFSNPYIEQQCDSDDEDIINQRPLHTSGYYHVPNSYPSPRPIIYTYRTKEGSSGCVCFTALGALIMTYIGCKIFMEDRSCKGKKKANA